MLRTPATLSHGIITSFRIAAGLYPRLAPALRTPAALAIAVSEKEPMAARLLLHQRFPPLDMRHLEEALEIHDS